MMREKSVVVWKAEVGKGKSRKTSSPVNQAVERNPEPFPLEFVFQLTIKEILTLKSSISSSQIVTLKFSTSICDVKREVR